MKKGTQVIALFFVRSFIRRTPPKTEAINNFHQLLFPFPFFLDG